MMFSSIMGDTPITFSFWRSRMTPYSREERKLGKAATGICILSNLLGSPMPSNRFNSNKKQKPRHLIKYTKKSSWQNWPVPWELVLPSCVCTVTMQLSIKIEQSSRCSCASQFTMLTQTAFFNKTKGILPIPIPVSSPANSSTWEKSSLTSSGSCMLYTLCMETLKLKMLCGVLIIRVWCSSTLISVSMCRMEKLG